MIIMNRKVHESNSIYFRLETVFQHLVDSNRKYMPVHKIADGLRALDLNPTPDMITTLSAPYMQKEVLDEGEFLNIYEKCVLLGRSSMNAEEVASIFSQICPVDCTGFVIKSVMHELLTTEGDRLTKEEADELLHKFQNEQGKIDMKNFVTQILNHKIN